MSRTPKLLRPAPYLALLLVVTALAAYAIRADGFTAHQPELHDGGIWVTNSGQGFYGRLNKPIAQLDAAVFARSDASLDVVQDGASVIGVDVSGGVVAPIDPSTAKVPGGEEATTPAGSTVALRGGTLAVGVPDGRVWASRVDPVTGLPLIADVATESEPLGKVGQAAALAVGSDGRLLAVSGQRDALTTYVPQGTGGLGLGKPQRSKLGFDLGGQSGLTAVGTTPVVLDRTSGRLQAVGPDADDASPAEVAPDAVLQQSGPESDSVLVSEGSRFVEMDLGSGATHVLADGFSGRPAAPVRLGACRYAAWGGAAAEVITSCEGAEPVRASLGAASADLAFRVNRDQIVLNDRSTGAVWDISSDKPTRLDDWDSFRTKVKETDKDQENEQQDRGDSRPPQAKDDQFGARAGRTSVLHPLDNDSAPQGRLLAIRSVKALSLPDARVTISPDGQTLQLTMPEPARRLTFDYYVDDGRAGKSAHATVTVVPRSEGDNVLPALREGFEPHTWSVPAGGVLDLPVLPDWRDNADGDPVSLDSAEAVGGSRSGAVARTTAAGRVRFQAPAKGGNVTVRYAVTDGHGDPVEERVRIRVQGPKETQPFPAVAEPDVISGEVGEAITIRPLGNDLPGSDPLLPEAALRLAGKVVARGGGVASTDLADGTVTFRASTAKTYTLGYEAAYGNAPFAHGQIRVDVHPQETPPRQPVAMPDSVTLYGQDATLVDVLSNDIDPAGKVLVVQGAEARAADQLDVAVVSGRWVRLAARGSTLSPNPQVVRYSISNGSLSADGEIVVAQKPAPADNTPVTEVDRVTVRAGASVSVPVLDNDYSPSGDPLHLLEDVADADAGQLPVVPQGDPSTPAGRAYVADRFVRYVAPADLADAGAPGASETFTVTYQASNSRGLTAPGRVEITVLPRERTNQVPEPPLLEARAVAGDAVTLRLPGSGVDPDGDPVTLMGLDSAPRLGRVLAIDATTIRYEPFPGSSGTETFGYRVADPYGGEAVGQVRVGVAPADVPQAPLAVADTISSEPGRALTIDVLGNDHLAPGDRVEVKLVDPPAGARLQGPSGPLLLEAPAEVGRNLELVYRLDNGVDTSQATVTVRVVEPYDNPPVVPDAYGEAGDPQGADGADGADGATVTVDVLKGAHDPDGSVRDLEVTEVTTPPGVRAVVSGRRVTVDQTDHPQVVPFRVEDADGGATTASLFVPARNDDRPFLSSDGTIALEPGGSTDEQLADYVASPSGDPVHFTLKDRIWASPAGRVRAAITDDGTFEVSAPGDYTGPGSVSFEVTTGADVDDATGVRAILTVPVQVGSTKPVLRCPAEPVRVAQGQTLTLSPSAICHTWTADPADANALSYQADWAQEGSGLSIIDPEGTTVSVSASGNAQPGTRGRLQLTADGSDPGELVVEVVAVPPPSMAPVRIADLQAGSERTIDLAPYLRAGVDRPQPRVLSIEQVTDLAIRASANGSSVTLRTGERVDGSARFRVTMTDVDGEAPETRQATGELSLDILDRPGTPVAPVPGTVVRSAQVALSWTAPEANGAPVDGYEVKGSDGRTTRCPGTSCIIDGLTNGEPYRFTVRAHNAVGWSDPSPLSAPATPDERPEAVGPIQQTRAGDGTLELSWTPPPNKTSAIRRYHVTWPGGGSKVVSGTSAPITGLDNNKTYVFTVVAENALALGAPRTSAALQSIGAPGQPAAPRITDQQTPGDQGAVTVSWDPVSANGPGPATYTVTRNGAPLPQCTDLSGTSCDDAGITYDGKQYTYAVVAENRPVAGVPGGEARSTTGPGAGWSAVGSPAGWGAYSVKPTGADNTAQVQMTVPPSRGARSVVRIYVNNAVVDEFEATGAATRNVRTPNNDQDWPVRLEVCNEASRCSGSAGSSVWTYGPLQRHHIVNIVTERNGSAVRFRVTWDGNGDDAEYVIRARFTPDAENTDSCNDNGVWNFTPTGRGTETHGTGWMNCGYGEWEATARLRDLNPSRGDVNKVVNETIPAPPQRVQVYRGEKCNDSPSSSLQACNKTGTSYNCIHASCGFIVIETENFRRSETTCDINTSDGPIASRTIPTNRAHQTTAYFGFPTGWVQVKCGANITSTKYDWPDR